MKLLLNLVTLLVCPFCAVKMLLEWEHVHNWGCVLRDDHDVVYKLLCDNELGHHHQLYHILHSRAGILAIGGFL